jgi:hypothetical protein
MSEQDRNSPKLIIRYIEVRIDLATGNILSYLFYYYYYKIEIENETFPRALFSISTSTTITSTK